MADKIGSPNVERINPLKEEKVNPLKKDKVTPDEKNEKPKVKRNRRNILIAVSAIVLMVLVLFLVKPGILGLGVYEDGESEFGSNETDTVLTIEDRIELLSTQLEERDGKVVADLLQSLDDKTSVFEKLSEDLDQLTACLDAKSSLETERGMYEVRIDSIEEECNENNIDLEQAIDDKNDRIAELEAELEGVEDISDGLIGNMAKIICCIKKVGDSSINSYTIEGDNVVCSGSGEHELSCFS